MSLKTVAVVTGVGNVGFAATLLNTIGRDGDDTPLYYMEDVTSGCDFSGFERLYELSFDGILRHTGHGGCNALWGEAVRWAESEGYECVVVLNDDIQASRPGLFKQLRTILDQNDSLAMAGTASDGAWDDEHHAKERWWTDPSLLVELDSFCDTFRNRPARHTHHVSGIAWACKPRLWLEAGGIPEELFWAAGEVVPCKELYRMGYYCAAVQYPVTLTHFGGGAMWNVHSDARRHESFNRRAAERGDDGAYLVKRYGSGHVHLMVEEWQREYDKRTDVPKLIYNVS